MRRLTGQLDLPLGRKAQPDERRLLARLREARGPRQAGSMSRAEIKRLMTPLPRITVLDA